MIKLFIIEGQPSVAKGLRLLFGAEADLSIVGEAADCRAALHVLCGLCPDVVLTDIDCAHAERRALSDALRQIAGQASVILLTHLDNPETGRLSEQVGATAVVIKSSPPDELLDAIRQAAGAA